MLRAFVLVAALAAPEAAPATAAGLAERTPASHGEAHRFNLSYDVSLTGIPMMSLEISAVVTPDRYALRSYLFTYGVLDLMFRVRNESAVDGTISGENIKPTRYTTVGTWRGSQRMADLMYRGNEVTADVQPPVDDEDRDPVPDALRRGTMDPLSPIVTLSLGTRAAKPCQTMTLPVFDGRRRYNMRLELVGEQFLDAGTGGIAAGRALKCLLTVEPIAGYPKSRPMERRPPSEIWFQRMSDDSIWIPVRIKGDSFFGGFSAELRRYEPRQQM